MRTLYVMPYSPWSERARWMLLHHKLDFTEREHLPLLGELPLRFAARRPFSRVSVPLLVDRDVRIDDSLAIARHVDGSGGGESLIPGEHADAIARLNEELEPAMESARARAIAAIMKDDEAAISALPAALRGLPGAAASARLGSRFIASKHRTPFADEGRAIRDALAAIRQQLGGRRYLLDRFSYADIIAATTVHLAAPVSDDYMPLDPVTRRTWSDEALASEFSDLIAWRDDLYARHRPR